MPGTGGIMPISYGYNTISPYSTMYDSYMPQFMGGMAYPYGMDAYAGYGMGGYYGAYPMSMMGYPVYMQEMYNERERLSINHAHDMHKRVVDMEAAAYDDSNKAIVRKTLSNGTVLKSMNSLRSMVLKGDQNGICQEFDNLVADVMNEYGSEFASRGKGYNTYDGAITVIESMYSSLFRSRLRDDIKRYGDKTLANGFLQGFREDHHTMTIDETLHHIYGERIEQYQSMKNTQSMGKAFGIMAYGAEKMIIGAGIGATGYAGIWGASKAGKYLFGMKGMKFNLKSMGKWAAVAAVIYTGYKCIKRAITKNNNENNQ